MTNKNGRLVVESSANSTDAATGQLLSASPLTLEAVRALAVSARDAPDLATALPYLREQIHMLTQLICQSESEEKEIYEWASGQ